MRTFASLLAAVSLTSLASLAAPAEAGPRTGVRQSVRTAAQREAAPASAPWARSAATSSGRALREVRVAARAPGALPGSDHASHGADTAGREIQLLVAPYTGKPAAQVRSDNRRHDRALIKAHRAAIRRIDVAEASRRTVADAFPAAPAGASFGTLRAAEVRAIDEIARGARYPQ